MKLKLSKRTNPKRVNRIKKKVRIRKVVNGTPERPRLCIYKSLANIYAQVIDDIGGTTLAAASTLEDSFKGKKGKEAAKLVGAEVAKRALAKKIETVVFDRNGNKYHGRVLELAQAAREAGLKF